MPFPARGTARSRRCHQLFRNQHLVSVEIGKPQKQQLTAHEASRQPNVESVCLAWPETERPARLSNRRGDGSQSSSAHLHAQIASQFFVAVECRLGGQIEN